MDIEKLLSSVPTGLWIGGEERQGSSTFDVLNPATDEVLISIANATPADGIAALDAAAGVQQERAATPPRERGEAHLALARLGSRLRPGDPQARAPRTTATET